jgi:Na+-translocating ferredoxin:NAD+ oxidoreductase subunit B
MDEHDLIERIERELPQTQCGRCGYPACTPYAQALAVGRATIDRCPPGGAATRNALAELLELEPPAEGTERADEPQMLAVVVEAECIGCTKCIQACPVDAIVGASGALHGIVAQWCTGCALCLPVCPTDCIVLYPDPAPAQDATTRRRRAAEARARHGELRRRREEQSAEAMTQTCYVDADTYTAGELREAVLAAVARRRAT